MNQVLAHMVVASCSHPMYLPFFSAPVEQDPRQCFFTAGRNEVSQKNLFPQDGRVFQRKRQRKRENGIAVGFQITLWFAPFWQTSKLFCNTKQEDRNGKRICARRKLWA
jgi:hypothetical protein